VFAIFGEPLAETRAAVDDFRLPRGVVRAAPDFNMCCARSWRNRGRAWDKAHSLLATSNARPASAEAEQPFQRAPAWIRRARRCHDERLVDGDRTRDRARAIPRACRTPEQIAAQC